MRFKPYLSKICWISNINRSKLKSELPRLATQGLNLIFVRINQCSKWHVNISFDILKAHLGSHKCVMARIIFFLILFKKNIYTIQSFQLLGQLDWNAQNLIIIFFFSTFKHINWKTEKVAYSLIDPQIYKGHLQGFCCKHSMWEKNPPSLVVIHCTFGLVVMYCTFGLIVVYCTFDLVVVHCIIA